MPAIMIRCPVFNKAVPTGLSTDSVVFESLTDIGVPLRCPACKKLHHWKPKDAWVQGEGQPRPSAPGNT